MATSPGEPCYRASERALLTELGDGTAVLLDLDSKFYFTLNDTAIFVWRFLSEANAPSTREQLVAALTAEFETDGATAQADLESLLDALCRERLISVATPAP
jgi:hypothetical protein